jgi:hypothetical protein
MSGFDELDDELLEFAAGGAQPTIENDGETEEGEAFSRSQSPLSRSPSYDNLRPHSSDRKLSPSHHTNKMPAQRKKTSRGDSAEEGET